MINFKSLTLRAAEANKKGGTSKELRALWREVAERIEGVGSELKKIDLEMSKIERDGDLDAMRAARQKQTDLKDEERILLRQRTDLHESIKKALGEEAVAGFVNLSKDLANALHVARKAKGLLTECQITVNKAITERRAALDIGKDLDFNNETIVELCKEVFSDSNQAKQAMLDLGVAAPRPMRGLNPGTARAS